MKAYLLPTAVIIVLSGFVQARGEIVLPDLISMTDAGNGGSSNPTNTFVIPKIPDSELTATFTSPAMASELFTASQAGDVIQYDWKHTEEIDAAVFPSAVASFDVSFNVSEPTKYSVLDIWARNFNTVFHDGAFSQFESVTLDDFSYATQQHTITHFVDRPLFTTPNDDSAHEFGGLFLPDHNYHLRVSWGLQGLDLNVRDTALYNGEFLLSFEPQAVPEPSTAWLLIAGVAGCCICHACLRR